MSSTEVDAARNASAWLMLRIALSITLLVWLFTSIDVGSLRAALNPRLLWSTLGAGVLVLASAAPAAERWRIIARNSGVALSRSEALRATVLSFVALQFAPSTLGADAIRLASLRRSSGRWSQKTASVLIDRAYGVLSLVMFAPISVVILLIVQSDLAIGAALLTLLSIVGVAAALLLSCLSPPRAWLRRGTVRAIARMALAFRRACIDMRVAVPAITLSLVAQGFCMAAFWLVLVGAGADAGVGAVLGSFPVTGLVSLAPISINGWGIREASVLPLLSGFQIAGPTALAASVAYGVATAIAGGLGALAWIAAPGHTTRLPRFSLPGAVAAVATKFSLPLAYALAVCVGFPMLVVALVPSAINQSSGFIDPALYTALIHDYGALVERFGPTYYATRVSYVFAAKAIYAVLGDDAGYIVFRVVLLSLFCGGIYFSIKRWAGAGVATIIVAIAVTTPWALRSFFYDYVEGAATAYLCAGFAFALAARERTWKGLAAGVLFALAINTHIGVVPYGAAFFVAWLILLNQPPIVMLKQMAVIAVGFVLTYAAMSAAMYANYPAFGPFFEALTFRTTGRLFEGGASVWFHPLSAVMDAGLYYVAIPFLTLTILGPLTVIDRSRGDMSRFRLAACVQLTIVCVWLAVLHFVFRAGVFSHPWAMICAFPATLMAWAAILAPAFARKPPMSRWALVTSFCLLAVGAFFTARFWLRLQVDDHDIAFACLIALLIGVAFFPRVRVYATALAMLLIAQVPYRYEVGQTGFSSYFADMHRVGAVDQDVVDGGRALLDLVTRDAPSEEGPIGLWHDLPDPENFIGLDGFLFGRYSTVMGDGSEGMPDLDERTLGQIEVKSFLVLVGRDTSELGAGLAALNRAGVENQIVRQGIWRGRVWSYAYALTRIVPAWERELTTMPRVLRTYDLTAFQANAGARFALTSTLSMVTDAGAGGFSAVLPLGPDVVQPGPVYLRVRLRVTSGRLQFVVTQQNWPADYDHFTMTVPVGEQETTIYVPIDIQDDQRLFIVANGSQTGASAAEIRSAELVTRPADTP